jgi:hypothetical protein
MLATSQYQPRLSSITNVPKPGWLYRKTCSKVAHIPEVYFYQIDVYAYPLIFVCLPD